MAVKLRLQRHGRRNRPFFRIVAIEGRKRREGEELEVVGHYDPLQKEENASVKVERVRHWLSVGAQPSKTVADILKKHGVEVAGRGK